MKIFFLLLSFLVGFVFNGNSQTQFYFQDFEEESNESSIDWTFSHSSLNNNNNYWVWGSGTTGATTGAATYEGTGSLQVWRRASNSWNSAYGNHTNQNRTAQKTFDLSSIPLDSYTEFSFYLLSNGEVSTFGTPIFYDYFQVEINGDVILGPLVGVTSWTLQTIDISSYVGNSSVTIIFRWINDGSVDNQTAARVDNVKIEYTEDIALPVTLISFTTECNGSIPVLKWTTASEQNSYYFGIERSRDGFKWNEVSQVQASGNSISIKNYQYYDMSPGRFEGYYRLKQVDFNGQFEYFSPKYSNCTESMRKLESEVFPNPVSDEAFIGLRNNQEEDAQLIVLDNIGRIIFQENMKIIDGYTLKTVEMKNYQSGIYQFIIVTSNYKLIHKIIKK